MSPPNCCVADEIGHPNPSLDSKNHVVLLSLVLLASALFFLKLGTPGLFDADEPAYAGAAREMLERGDWVTPYFNGQPRFDKPILFYWPILLAATMSSLILTAALAVVPTAYSIVQGSLRAFAEEARGFVRPGDPVLVYGLNAPSVVFYANRRIRPIGAGALGEIDRFFIVSCPF